jgi:hypothetical protein
MNVENWLGDAVCEIDTDGYYLSSWEEGRERKLNAALDKLVRRVTGNESFLELEHESCGSGYFYRAKNYILWDGERITYHGVGFKSSRFSGVYENALKKVAKAVVTGATDMWPIIEEARDFTGLEIPDFTMRFKLAKEIKDYTNQNAMQVRMAKRVQEILGYEPTIGDQVEYVVAKGREYKLLRELESVDEIDTDYYMDDVRKVLGLFNIHRPLEITDEDMENMGIELVEEDIE